MTELKNFTCEGYERKDYRFLSDIDAEGLIMRHTKSGARIVLLSNDDPNKIFAIGFRTTPTNSTGVPHIMEHSVLCGSVKYPVKEVFSELGKGSLRTFLNAFTGPDWTCYPVGSCNDKDFKNLVDVYMDVVLHPLIAERKEIFLQEGWRYELESPEAELGINGVVYSEMKGAYSSPDSFAYKSLMQAVFPDTTYGSDSGGDPDVIPELSFEEFLEFHRTYYSPANSYIFLYGNADMGEMLSYLDREYLSAYDIIPVDSEVKLQKPLGFRKVEQTYPIGEEESEKGRTYLQYAAKVYDGVDAKKSTAWNILSSLLFNMPGAPVKKALMDAGIGSDASAFLNRLRQSPFLIRVDEAEPEQAEQFLAIIRDKVAETVKNGIDKKTVAALLNRNEINYRVNNFGGELRGLDYLMSALSVMLYDEDRTFDPLNLGEVYAELRKELDTGYFEQLLQEFLDSDHSVLVVVKPEKGLGAKKENALREKLAAMKAAMSEQKIDALVKETAALKAYQSRTETAEELACIPVLSREDIDKKPLPLDYTVEKVAGDVPLIHVDNATGGITYIQVRFDVTDLPEEELPYLKLYANVLNEMDTENYTYPEFQNEINSNMGSMYEFPEATSVKGEEGEIKGFLTSGLNVPDGNAKKGLELLFEALWRTKFTDTKRLLQLMSENAVYLPDNLISNGSNTASTLAMMQFSPRSRFVYYTDGEGYYACLRQWIDGFEEQKDEIIRHMENIRRHILRKSRLSYGISADSNGYAQALPAFVAFAETLSEIPQDDPIQETAKLPRLGGYHLPKNNEMLTHPGAVQYNAAAGSFRRAGYPYSGVFRVFQTILNWDYLWAKIRIQGGAYGTDFWFDERAGDIAFSTYRDPNLKESYKIFEGAAEFAEQLDLSEHDLTRFLLGTIGDMDMPYTPPKRMYTALHRFYTGTTQEDVQRERTELLSVTNEQLRAFGPMIRDVLKQNYRATVASETKAKECADFFDTVRPLRK